MIISGAFLAEAAAVENNKLQVQGGVITEYLVGPDRVAQFVIVVLTHGEPHTRSGGGRHAVAAAVDRFVQIEVRPPGGRDAPHLDLEVPEDLVDSEVGCAFFPIDLQVPVDGRYEILLDGCGATMLFPLTVHS